MNAHSSHGTALLAMFRAGKDTFDIAKQMKTSEASVSKAIWIARSQEKNLPTIMLTVRRK
jgi:hypothetical protein